MANNIQIQISKDLQNKKIKVIREFNAPLDRVWSAWTTRDLLDQWWAPKPWVAKTKTLDFKEGGNWLYAMIGPDGTKMWSLVEFISIKRNKSFQSVCSFCDENGKKNSEFPSMNWKNEFMATNTGTKVDVEISFTSEADIKKIIEMGFEAGFTSGLANLDELLAK